MLTTLFVQLAQIDIGKQFLFKGLPIQSPCVVMLLGTCIVPGSGVFADFASFLSPLLKTILLVASLVLFFLLIFGGFTLIVASGNPEQQQKGKQAITSSLIGFTIIFVSFWILQIIKVITGLDLLPI